MTAHCGHSRWLLAAILLCASQAGCVQRRLTIRSNPPGARVYIDGYEIGTTPCSTPFIYYGTRQIRLVKDRYETLTVYQKIGAPWYQLFPLDFVSENVVPTEIRDERALEFQLVPQRVASTEQLLERAENLRQGNRGGGVLPTGACTLPPSAPIHTLPPGGVSR